MDETTKVNKIIKGAEKYSGDRWPLWYLYKNIRDTYIKPQNYSIIIGTDINQGPQWWVVTNREASILVKHGYEQAY